jgi:hypothetical protein
MLLTERNEIKIKISNLSDDSFGSGPNPQTQYMSPEVFKSQVMDIKYYPNTDIWYEMFY